MAQEYLLCKHEALSSNYSPTKKKKKKKKRFGLQCMEGRIYPRRELTQLTREENGGGWNKLER
jgi:hypothetical protein